MNGLRTWLKELWVPLLAILVIIAACVIASILLQARGP